MPYDPNELFAGDASINAELHQILPAFRDPSRSRMLRRLRQARTTLRTQGTDDADAQARHIFREFLVGRALNNVGFQLEYDKNIGSLNPDWYNAKNQLVVEVFTCERGGRSDALRRIAERIEQEVGTYRELLLDQSLRFVVAVHPDFFSLVDDEDFEEALADYDIFVRNPELSGVIHFAESGVEGFVGIAGCKTRKQLYGFKYFANPGALRPIDIPL